MGGIERSKWGMNDPISREWYVHALWTTQCDEYNRHSKFNQISMFDLQTELKPGNDFIIHRMWGDCELWREMQDLCEKQIERRSYIGEKGIRK